MLSDNELKALLPALKFRFADAAHKFEDFQVQPASIDLRVDNVFWRFRKSGLLSLHPNDRPPPANFLWDRTVLKPDGFIELRPGEMVLGRTLERFTMPDDHAGLLEGRSSYARLGLQVVLSGGFVAPGFDGHKSMQIVNHNRMAIRIYPFIPICQLVIWRTTSKASLPYGARELNSKYLGGDAGPSYWWKDSMLDRLRLHMTQISVHAAVQERVLHLVGPADPKILARLDRFIRKLRLEHATSAETIVEKFCKMERRRRNWYRIRLNGARLLAGTFVGLLLRELSLGFPSETRAYLIGLVAALLLSVAIKDWFADPPKFFIYPDMPPGT